MFGRADCARMVIDTKQDRTNTTKLYLMTFMRNVVCDKLRILKIQLTHQPSETAAAAATPEFHPPGILRLLSGEFAQPIRKGGHKILRQTIGPGIRDAVARYASVDICRLLEDIIGTESQETVLLLEHRFFK